MVASLTKRAVVVAGVMAACVLVVLCPLCCRKESAGEVARKAYIRWYAKEKSKVSMADVATNDFAARCPWAYRDPHEVLARPTQIEVGSAEMGRLVEIQSMLVQAYTSEQASVLREWRQKLPEMLEHMPFEQFRGAMLGFVYMVWNDVAGDARHSSGRSFQDAAALSRFLDVRTAAVMLIGDVLLRRKAVGDEIRSFEGYMLGALRNLEEKCIEDGRVDLQDEVVRCRRKWIEHIESEDGYTRAATVNEIAYFRLYGFRVIGMRLWEDFIKSEIEYSAIYLLKYGRYRPKWIDELKGIPEPEWVGSGCAASYMLDFPGGGD